MGRRKPDVDARIFRLGIDFRFGFGAFGTLLIGVGLFSIYNEADPKLLHRFEKPPPPVNRTSQVLGGALIAAGAGLWPLAFRKPRGYGKVIVDRHGVSGYYHLGEQYLEWDQISRCTFMGGQSGPVGTEYDPPSEVSNSTGWTLTLYAKGRAEPVTVMASQILDDRAMAYSVIREECRSHGIPFRGLVVEYGD